MLLALVANGPINALIMLAIVLVVQQLESHILQPLVMGKAVALHPVAVILSVAAGSYLAGIPGGALFAVPLLAVVNTAVRYIAGRTWEHDEGLGGVELQPAAASAGGPGGDANFKEVHLPRPESRLGKGVAGKTKASGEHLC